MRCYWALFCALPLVASPSHAAFYLSRVKVIISFRFCSTQNRSSAWHIAFIIIWRNRGNKICCFFPYCYSVVVYFAFWNALARFARSFTAYASLALLNERLFIHILTAAAAAAASAVATNAHNSLRTFCTVNTTHTVDQTDFDTVDTKITRPSVLLEQMYLRPLCSAVR